MHEKQAFNAVTMMWSPYSTTSVIHCACNLANFRDVVHIIMNSRAHWPLARITVSSKISNLPFLTNGKFLECDKRLYSEFISLFYNFVYHILETCRTSENL